ncbi:MAG: hypothetical protein ACI8TP_000413 [Acidimicrobiales bacterium]|jgi:hypothetical protein
MTDLETMIGELADSQFARTSQSVAPLAIEYSRPDVDVDVDVAPQLVEQSRRVRLLVGVAVLALAGAGAVAFSLRPAQQATVETTSSDPLNFLAPSYLPDGFGTPDQVVAWAGAEDGSFITIGETTEGRMSRIVGITVLNNEPDVGRFGQPVTITLADGTTIDAQQSSDSLLLAVYERDGVWVQTEVPSGGESLVIAADRALKITSATEIDNRSRRDAA